MVWWSGIACSGAPASVFFSGITDLGHRGCVEGRACIYRQRTEGCPNKILRVLRASFEAPKFMRLTSAVEGVTEQKEEAACRGHTAYSFSKVPGRHEASLPRY